MSLVHQLLLMRTQNHASVKSLEIHVTTTLRYENNGNLQSKSSTNFFADVPSPFRNKLRKDFRISLDTTLPGKIFLAKNSRGLLSCVLSTDRIEIHQSQPASMTLRRSEGHTSGLVVFDPICR